MLCDARFIRVVGLKLVFVECPLGLGKNKKLISLSTLFRQRSIFVKFKCFVFIQESIKRLSSFCIWQC